MGYDTGIDYLDSTWNFVYGCRPRSAGCARCWAARQATRGAGVGGPFEGCADGGRWTGRVKVNDKRISLPLSWQAPRRIGVNFMGDLFFSGVSSNVIQKALDVMVKADRHVFMLLTKRPDRMADELTLNCKRRDRAMMPSNIWAGISVEDQGALHDRWQGLADSPVMWRWLSLEPLLEEVDLLMPLPLLARFRCAECQEYDAWPRHACPSCWSTAAGHQSFTPEVDWVVVGGESGAGARPTNPEWVRLIRNQCIAAQVPFMFKQWGAWMPLANIDDPADRVAVGAAHDTIDWGTCGSLEGWSVRLSKEAAGHVLDGCEYMTIPAEAMTTEERKAAGRVVAGGAR